MVNKRTKPSEQKRLSVSLEKTDYQRLKALAEGHKPRLSLRYAVEYAVKDLLKRAEDPQFVLDFGNPLPDKDANEQT